MRIYGLVLLLILALSNPVFASRDYRQIEYDAGAMRGLDGVGESGGGGFGPDEPWNDVVGGSIQGNTQTIVTPVLAVTLASTPTNQTVVKGSRDVDLPSADKTDDPLVTALKKSGIIVNDPDPHPEGSIVDQLQPGTTHISGILKTPLPVRSDLYIWQGPLRPLP